MREVGKSVESLLVDLIPRFLSFSLSLTRRRETAEDLVHDVVTEFLANKAKGSKDPDNLEAWLIRLIRNRFIDGYRRDSRRGLESLDEAHEVPGNDERDPVLATTLEKCLGLRPINERELLISCGLGYSYADMAGMFDVPLGTVMSMLARARTLLAECLDQ